MAENMTAEQLAQYLRTTPGTIRRLARQGLLPGEKVGRMWRFDKAEIDDWFDAGGTEYERLVDEGLLLAMQERMATAREEDMVPWEEVKARLEE